MALSGCNGLPSSGPNPLDIEVYSESKPIKQSDKPRLRFELVDVNENVLSALASRNPKSLNGTFGNIGSADKIVVGRGDQVAVTIWEAAQGGLFTGQEGASASTIPPQPVSSDGTITVPYAGRVRAAGRTPYQIKRTVEQALRGKAIEPQVLVSVTKPIFNTVTVTGDASRGGRVPLSGRGDRLLEVIATAGGPTAPVAEVFVQLTRGSKTRRVPLTRVISRPSENIFMRSGDIVTLLRDIPTVTVFGATARNLEVPVDPTDTVLNEVIARAGGLRTDLSDPKAVFIYRVEDADLVSQMIENSPLVAENTLVPVIYRINLKDPSGFFVARGFRMFDKDILYVADAPAVGYSKFTRILTDTITPIAVGTSIASQVK